MASKMFYKKPMNRITFAYMLGHIPMNLPDFDEQTLHMFARIYYRRRHEGTGKSPEDLGEKDMRRITTNYLRHEVTGYDKALQKNRIHLSNGQCASLKTLVNEKIWVKFPFLKPGD